MRVRVLLENLDYKLAVWTVFSSQRLLSLTWESVCIKCVVDICEQGGAVRDPPDQSQDEGLSGANNSQATPPIPVPAIVKVSNI